MIKTDNLIETTAAAEQKLLLQEHFTLFYQLLAKGELVPNAAFEATAEGPYRCLSGIPVPYYNGLIGSPASGNSHRLVEEQLAYFAAAKVPFIWYVDEASDSYFKNVLLSYGFQNGGVFRGVIGTLNRPQPPIEKAAGITLELVTDEIALDEFNEIVCEVFHFEGVSKEFHKKALQSAANQGDGLKMYHWIARKNGKAVSTLSTLLQGKIASVWSGASLPEVRHQGIYTALRHFAMQDAIAKGCELGVSYLMAEGLAFGICSRLGYETRWRFNAYIYN